MHFNRKCRIFEVTIFKNLNSDHCHDFWNWYYFKSWNRNNIRCLSKSTRIPLFESRWRNRVLDQAGMLVYVFPYRCGAIDQKGFVQKRIEALLVHWLCREVAMSEVDPAGPQSRITLPPPNSLDSVLAVVFLEANISPSLYETLVGVPGAQGSRLCWPGITICFVFCVRKVHERDLHDVEFFFPLEECPGRLSFSSRYSCETCSRLNRCSITAGITACATFKRFAQTVADKSEVNAGIIFLASPQSILSQCLLRMSDLGPGNAPTAHITQISCSK